MIYSIYKWDKNDFQLCWFRRRGIGKKQVNGSIFKATKKQAVRFAKKHGVEKFYDNSSHPMQIRDIQTLIT